MMNGKKVGGVVVGWYKATFGKDDGKARAARARLRRCNSPVEALIIPETHILNEQLKAIGQKPTAAQLTLLTTTFARLRSVNGPNVASEFGKRKKGNESRSLSELRFQSLIRHRTHQELIIPLRRALFVLGSDIACDGRALAEDLYFWNDKIRNRWCFSYFGSTLEEKKQGEITQ